MYTLDDMYLVNDFYTQYGEHIGLKLVAGSQGLKKQITLPEAHLPGLALTGYLKGFAKKCLLVFGKIEVEYLTKLPKKERIERLKKIITKVMPAVISAPGYKLEELNHICEENGVAMFQSHMETTELLHTLNVLLKEEFLSSTTCHGTLVEVNGRGILIKGPAAVGKSETALGLIKRGHKLISDDAVLIKKRDDKILEGFFTKKLPHHMHIRGVGIIDIAKLYGKVAVKDKTKIDMVIQLENWDEKTTKNKEQPEMKCDILGVQIPFHTIPVNMKRDIVLLLETIALTQCCDL